VGDLAAKLQSVSRPSLAASITHQLRDLVLAGDLKPGEQLPGHRELAQLFGVSVPSVREAISALVTAGMLEAQPGRGTFVSQAMRPDLASPAVLGTADSEEEIDDLVEARWALELLLAGLAARRATEAQIKELRRTVAEMDGHVGDAERYLEADLSFHLQVAAAAQNRVLRRAMFAIRALLKRALRLNLERDVASGVDVRASVALHAQIVEAIAARDAAGAQAAMNQVVTRSGRAGRVRHEVDVPRPV
jgi:GntR family transcriptional repressor for pyruvate dehydrogenase complex